MVRARPVTPAAPSSEVILVAEVPALYFTITRPGTKLAADAVAAKATLRRHASRLARTMRNNKGNPLPGFVFARPPSPASARTLPIGTAVRQAVYARPASKADHPSRVRVRPSHTRVPRVTSLSDSFW